MATAGSNQNKTQPTGVSIDAFLDSIEPRRAAEARTLIPIIEGISGEPAVMWGPSIIGCGEVTYQTSRGSERMPALAFSPRKAQLTIYFSEGFDHYGAELDRLGPHKISRSCLYVTRLERIDLEVLTEMFRQSFAHYTQADAKPAKKPTVPDEYAAQVPPAARAHFDQLRSLAREVLPQAEEKLSYGIIGYVPAGYKRAYAFISGFKDHVAIYPVPKLDAVSDAEVRAQLERIIKKYQRGKGTLWLPLKEELPVDDVRTVLLTLMT